jgi:hypothetical protein
MLLLILRGTSVAHTVGRTLEELILLPFKHISGWQLPLQRLVRAAVVHKEDVVDLKNVVKAFAIVSRLAVFVDTLHEWRTHELLKQSERTIEGIPVRAHKQATLGVHRRSALTNRQRSHSLWMDIARAFSKPEFTS